MRTAPCAGTKRAKRMSIEIKLNRSRVRSLQDNGVHKRMHRDIKCHVVGYFFVVSVAREQERMTEIGEKSHVV